MAGRTRADTVNLEMIGQFTNCVERGSPAEIAALNARFNHAQPFRHIMIDNFLTKEFSETLLAQFPQQDETYWKYCIEDDGKVGTNYSNGNPADFPPAYREFDQLVRSKTFVAYVETITGIEGLEYDPDYFGGGIRESRSNTFLPPHIDFNYHPKTLSHRRLNLLLYLNRQWKREWGGNLQLHRDPYVHSKGDSLVTSYEPLLNRCIIFETSEISWHAFDRLRLPEGVTRRAFTIYYYTRTRPDQEKIRFHNTEYVEPPLPRHIQAGYTLTDEDMNLISEAITRRDGRIRMLYEIRAQHDAKLAHVWKEYEYYLALSKSLAEKGTALIDRIWSKFRRR